MNKKVSMLLLLCKMGEKQDFQSDYNMLTVVWQIFYQKKFKKISCLFSQIVIIVLN